MTFTFLFLGIAFIAGILTVLAPCILPLLPVVIGGSVTGDTSFKRAFTVVAALGFSVVAFTLLLKVSTAFITVPPLFWQLLSGGLLILFGILTTFPNLWESLGITALLNIKGNRLMATGDKKQGFVGDLLVGIALGPVFTSCSPTYFIVLATILPANPVIGFIYLLAYTFGLSLSLLLIAVVGQRIVDRLDLAANPHGWFKRGLGILFIVIGLAVTFGIDKILATSLPQQAYGITGIEQNLLKLTNGKNGDATSTPTFVPLGTSATPLTQIEKSTRYEKAPELASPNAYLNTGGAPITIGENRGKNVVLIDFWTYSCINCQRTLPYLKAWNEKYKDQGLVIIGVHTPEFSFEQVQQNVADALKRFGITYPVVLDNQYKTWNAFGNQYWPRKYLIDIDGYIVYDHAGEGNYEETEKAIQRALKERAERLGQDGSGIQGTASVSATAPTSASSPETYFGASRNEFLGNGKPASPTKQSLTLPSSFPKNKLFLGGEWDIQFEHAIGSSGADVVYTYTAKEVYLVASSDAGAEIEVMQDGKPLGTISGADVNASGIVPVKESRLYKLIKNDASGTHTLKLHMKSGSVRFYTFTFG
ncbi:MAG: cytochrome c biogenesis protein DipZ [Patescibacteria group bacterium]